MQRGEKAREAAREAARRTQVPLLGATVIGIMAFSGIGLSPDATGEFLFSLFAVIGISLLLSWVLAITVTPSLRLLSSEGGTGFARARSYAGLIYRIYSARPARGIAVVRMLTVVLLVGMTGASIWAFQFVDSGLLPGIEHAALLRQLHASPGRRYPRHGARHR